jgi:ABC-type bacteriocin/lantibiotic exporter with double-glycine peptidase domain
MSTQPTIPTLATGGTIHSRRHTRVIAGVAAIGTALALLLDIGSLRDRALSRLAGGRYLDQLGVIRQRDADDCGVAVLAMVLAASHAVAPPTARTLDSLRVVIHARGRGLSMLELQRVATTLGLDVRGLRLTYADLARLSPPAIVHFRGHYVVLDRASDTTVTVRDPAVGRLRMTRASFERRWTGHVLVTVRPLRSLPTTSSR